MENRPRLDQHHLPRHARGATPVLPAPWLQKFMISLMTPLLTSDRRSTYTAVDTPCVLPSRDTTGACPARPDPPGSRAIPGYHYSSWHGCRTTEMSYSRNRGVLTKADWSDCYQ